ncbi:MAG: hypothetical protein NC041_07785 [Bacteroides sp.]|nr:hypothetical protein [Prevotella sp.]MCM1407201.1 hypothetical protein [Treponema brennaborense]MCM1470353.1 hypothetical protein [Bacteroides sp.]
MAEINRTAISCFDADSRCRSDAGGSDRSVGSKKSFRKLVVKTLAVYSVILLAVCALAVIAI